MQQPMQCLFCLISGGKIKSFKVYEDNLFLAVLDIKPASRGHIILFPKKHYEVLFQMSDEEVGKMFMIARRIAAALVSKGALGVDILCPIGDVAGQIFPHVHIVILPRYKNDEIFIGWKRKEISESELEKIRSEIATEIEKFLPKEEEKIIEEKKKEEEKEEEIIEVEEEEIPTYW